MTPAEIFRRLALLARHAHASRLQIIRLDDELIGMLAAIADMNREMHDLSARHPKPCEHDPHAPEPIECTCAP